MLVLPAQTTLVLHVDTLGGTHHANVNYPHVCMHDSMLWALYMCLQIPESQVLHNIIYIIIHSYTVNHN